MSNAYDSIITEAVWTAVRMANGKMTHIKTQSSSVTNCGRWTGNTRQYFTDEKKISCKGCAKSLQYYPQVIELGFSAE